MSEVITNIAVSKTCWHPRPGPLYWDWRCLNCDQPVAYHPSIRRRLQHWLTGEHSTCRELANKATPTRDKGETHG